MREVEFVLSVDNFVIEINYKVYSDDPEEEEKEMKFLERRRQDLEEVRRVKYEIPLGFKIVGVLLRDEVVIQDFVIMRVHATREYREFCEREAKK